MHNNPQTTSTPPHANQRAALRVLEHFGVLVESPNGDTLEMAARDLSEEGLCAEPGRWTVKQLWPEGVPEPGAKLDAVLLLPVGLHGRTFELQVHCRVCRLIRQSERRFEVGLQFLDMSGNCREILADYVEGHLPATAHH